MPVTRTELGRRGGRCFCGAVLPLLGVGGLQFVSVVTGHTLDGAARAMCQLASSDEGLWGGVRAYLVDLVSGGCGRARVGGGAMKSGCTNVFAF